MGHSAPRKTSTKARLSVKPCGDRLLPRTSRSEPGLGTLSPTARAAGFSAFSAAGERGVVAHPKPKAIANKSNLPRTLPDFMAMFPQHSPLNRPGYYLNG